MRFLLFIGVLASACVAADERPIAPGGGTVGGGTTTAPDAGTGGSSEQLTISGRLCLVNDLRVPDACPAVSGISGVSIEVASTGATATTSDDGRFSVVAPDSTIARLRIAKDNDGYRDLLVPVGLVEGSATGLSLPLITDTTWQSLLTTVGVAEPGGTASIVAYFVKEGFAVPGTEVLAPAGSSGFPLYDGVDGPNDWGGSVTGPRGAAILLGVPASNAVVDFVVLPPSSPALDASGVPVERDTLTFVTMLLP